jgi:hypothetical protein
MTARSSLGTPPVPRTPLWRTVNNYPVPGLWPSVDRTSDKGIHAPACIPQWFFHCSWILNAVKRSSIFRPSDVLSISKSSFALYKCNSDTQDTLKRPSFRHALHHCDLSRLCCHSPCAQRPRRLDCLDRPPLQSRRGRRCRVQWRVHCLQQSQLVPGVHHASVAIYPSF